MLHDADHNSCGALRRSSKPGIGDVMRKFAPFLKLYVDYVQNFDRAMGTINHWMEKSPKFALLIAELQVSESVLY